MPLQATSGAASYDAFGGGVPVVPAYIEEVFQTWLWNGNNSTQTITNNIDLSTKGGLVWIKGRDTAGLGASQRHSLYDTNRGAIKRLISNNSDAQADEATGLTAFNTTGFSIGSDAETNQTGYDYVGWTFREQPKFFDVVTYTGTGANRTVAHNLGSVPACIIVKRTNVAADWQVYHRSLANTQYIVLNSTAAVATGATRWNSTTPTSAVFSVGTDASVNASGATYVAYLFAHDAGGFGLTGTDNVISCGSYTGSGSNSQNISLGYEPQFLMIKNSGATGDWNILDNMRGLFVRVTGGTLRANTSDAEFNAEWVSPTATGFTLDTTSTEANASGNTYVYIAIRRGPMKVPTTGTSVFGLNARTGTGADATVTGSAGVSDAVLVKNRGSAVASLFSSRLTNTGYLVTSSTAAEVAAGTTILQSNPWDVMDGVKVGTTSTITNASGSTYINYLFKRAPSFFDEVCYTGNTTVRTLAHNLGAIPELMIVKRRSGGAEWFVYNAASGATRYLWLNSVDAQATLSTVWNNTAPTSSVFTVGANSDVNGNNDTYVNYLFATCPGVSKVGSYTGNDDVQTINCGFTGGARFVLIKRTDSTGSWYVWDTARGIVSGNDPYLLLNSSAAEVTNTDYIDTYSAGFEISSTAPSAINASGGTFIFLAIA
jgi:hypothetical protein